MTVTITRLFDKARTARAALDDLLQSGVSEDDLSVITNQSDVAELNAPGVTLTEAAGTAASVGGILGGAGGLLAGLGIIAIPGMGPLVAAGWIATTAAGVVAGAAAGVAAGGIVTALTDVGVSQHVAEGYVTGVQQGSTLITVRIADSHEAEIRAILDTHGPDTDVDAAAHSAALAASGVAPDPLPILGSR